jgi:hypothetical protein
MPDTFSCPATPGPPPVPGNPEPVACTVQAMTGRTGLPLSIWPGIPAPGCPPPGPDSPQCPHCPGLRAWAVITAFSRTGDLVAMTGPAAGCVNLTVAAVSTGRRIIEVTAGPPAEPAAQRSRSCQAIPGEMLPRTAGYGAGRAALAVAVWGGGSGLDAGEAASYAACRQVLRPGGILAVLAGRPAPGQVADLSLAVACARAAGLVYAQHIVLVHARIDGARLRPPPGLRLAAPSPCEGQRNTRIHTDLLIFTRPGSPE